MEGPVPPEHNIIRKAVDAFRSRTGFDGGVRIEAEKRVPLGAGLGGGSSDAASTLLALDSMAGTGLGAEGLAPIAEALGSDVPFFLYGGTALVGGRGERVEPVESVVNYAVVLVNPGFRSDTGAAFSALDRLRASSSAGIAVPLGGAALAAALRLPVGSWPFSNDFLSVLTSVAGEEAGVYARMLAALKDAGADFASLSGSGSTCFGVFSDPEKAEWAAKKLSVAWKFVQKALPLARSGDAGLE